MNHIRYILLPALLTLTAGAWAIPPPPIPHLPPQAIPRISAPSLPATLPHEVQHDTDTPTSPPRSPLTLEQAVQRVQNRTGGKVLKADSRNLGRIVEYRIKVLTPTGHVRVVTLRSDDNDAH